MCGICGIVDFKNGSTERQLDAMTDSLAHRGPDGRGVSFEEFAGVQIGLGHRRLAIIDLNDCAAQPMHFGHLSIVFNGEIYNYEEIRDELAGLGHRFITHSDTEVILHAWAQWGASCLERFRGMFAIALLDRLKAQLTCIRDRVGVKPFHYYFDGDLFLFGSELKAFRMHAGFPRAINEDSVASYLQFGYVGGNRSVYRDTHKLLPGELMTVDLATKTLRKTIYWDVYTFYNKPKVQLTLPEAIAETEKVLTEAFNYRMVADVPVGVFLSGGYDSSCVAALLAANTGRTLKTFTIGSGDAGLDEAPFAKEIARHLGTDHTDYYCTAKEALDIVPDLAYYYDEPFADSSAIPTILVSRLARKEVTVALSADGGDELFAGYNRYDYISRYSARIAAAPAFARKSAAALMDLIPAAAIPLSSRIQNFHGRYDKLKNLLRDPSPAELMKNLTRAFTPSEISSLMTRPAAGKLEAFESTQLVAGFDDPFAYMMAIDFQTYLPGDILQKVDLATMSTGLEGREPFLDHRIVEWAATLPSDYKYHAGQKKYITRQIVHRYIPETLMDRPKMGFGMPVHHWLRNELRDMVESYLTPAKLSQHGLFNTSEVTRLKTEFFNGRTERHLQIWYLLTFQLWYEHWFVNA